MAPPRSKVSQPGRALGALLIAIAALAGLMFWQGQTTPKLALDLAGGTSVTLTAVTEKGKTPPGSQMNQAVEIMRNRVNGLGVSEAEVAKQGDNVIVVQVPGQGQSRVVALIGTTAKLQFRQVFAETAAGPIAEPPPSPSPSGKATTTPSPGASKSPAAKTSASVSPSATPKGRALSQALTAPSPTPSPSGSATPGPTATPAPATPATPAVPGTADEKAALEQFQKADCSRKGTKLPGANDDRRQWVAVCDQDGTAKYLLGPVRVQGQQVGSAVAQPPNVQQGQVAWSVSMNFKKQGADQFYSVTKDAYAAYQKDPSSPQRQVAIVLDGQVVSAPEITRGAIGGGNAQIDGPPESFDQQYATDLANVLNYGALPLEFKQSAIESVSPTLGQDQLNAGLIAGAIGLGLVAIYCLLYYRGLGFVAIVSLMIAGLVTYLCVVLLGKFIDFRLSLAGIAGLIVAIGITADSFVVYFERLRDEVREGRSLRTAVERGWERARRTVLVADAVSFLAALVLYIVSIGTVRGFAFTLGLTTLIDVAVVFLFTKPMVTGLSRVSFFSRGHPLSGLDPRRLGAKSTASRGTGTTLTKEA
ncbi:protein translocase subunit SecD [Actinomadura scrupuli]|uniref:protein translocase subunit SecD n=1 Tax=Actinomadura scrupuli TaxID=559629 RepID=UPI003D96C096